jgi:hypothetical protein
MGGKERWMQDQVRHEIGGCTACAEVNFHRSWRPDAIGEWGILLKYIGMFIPMYLG